MMKVAEGLSNGAKAIWFYSKMHFLISIDCISLEKGRRRNIKNVLKAFFFSFTHLLMLFHPIEPFRLLTIEFNAARDDSELFCSLLFPLNCLHIFFVLKNLFGFFSQKFLSLGIGEAKIVA